MIDPISSMTHTLSIRRMVDTGLSESGSLVAQHVPCRIVEQSEGTSDVYGAPRGRGQGTAYLLTTATVLVNDLLEFGTRRLKVLGVRAVHAEFGLSTSHQLADWEEYGGVP